MTLAHLDPKLITKKGEALVVEMEWGFVPNTARREREGFREEP